MAINTGTAPHSAYLNCSAGSFLLEHGTVTQNGNRTTSTFSVALPRNAPGAEALASMEDGGGVSVSVSSVAGSGTLITGEVDSIDVDYVGGYVRVAGSDPSRDLQNTKISQKWINQPGSSIVSQVVGQAGLGANASAGGLLAGKLIEQDWVKLADNVTIGYLINRLAEFDGAKWFVTNDTFNYVGIGTTQGNYTVNCSTFGNNQVVSDAVRLDVRRNFQAGKKIDVTVKTWNTREKQSYTGESNASGKNSGSLSPKYTVPHLDEAHAKQYSRARAQELSRHAITVRATVIGDPSINQGMGLTLVGTNAFDGTYEIDHIVHNFGMSGYLMTIIAKSIGDVS